MDIGCRKFEVRACYHSEGLVHGHWLWKIRETLSSTRSLSNNSNGVYGGSWHIRT